MLYFIKLTLTEKKNYIIYIYIYIITYLVIKQYYSFKLLLYSDSDDDMVAFSSDDELMEALRNLTNGMFKVTIVKKNPASQQQQPQQQAMPPQQQSSTGVLHPGVTCDGCDGPVCGTRYKCLVCADYDLCSHCKGTGLHGEHSMRTIEVPDFNAHWSVSIKQYFVKPLEY